MNEIPLKKTNLKKRGIFLILTIIMTLSFSLAAIYFVYNAQDSRANELVTGLISIDFTEGSEVINLTDVTPVIDDVGLLNAPYEFTVKNTSQIPINAKIGLEIDETTTIHPGAVRYAFYVEDELIKIDHLANLDNGILHTIENMKVRESLNCKLIFWIDYYYETPLETFKANIKVIGESFDIIYEHIPTGAETIISKLGTGGLVAINTDGTLYDSSDSSQIIREYRYSGATANNYVIFNDDGDETEKEANELWRIVGVFKNSNDDWNLKLTRNTELITDELPETYVYNGTTYKIEHETTGEVRWNYTSSGTFNSDWTTAGLQYFLNTNSDTNETPGYYATFSDKAKNLIDTNYTYYLGNVYYDSTTIDTYNAERGNVVCSSSVTSNSHANNCNIWNGNQPTLNAAIGLLYPSDYGYSASSTYWNSTTLYNYATGPMDTSWLHKTANHSINEWFLSPSSFSADSASYWNDAGYVNYFYVDYGRGVRVVLNLVSETTMEDALGTLENPYRIIE